MSPEELQQITREAYKTLMKAPSTKLEVGNQVFESINSRTDLTPVEKQQVFCGLAQAVTTEECRKAIESNQPNTLMRGSNPATRFMSTYVTANGTEYFEAVKTESFAAGKRHDVTDVRTQNDPGLVSTGKDLLGAYTTSMPYMSTELSQFMKSCVDVIKQKMPEHQAKAVPLVMASTMVLRGGAPQIGIEAQELQKEVVEKAGKILGMDPLKQRADIVKRLENLNTPEISEEQRNLLTPLQKEHNELQITFEANKSVQEVANKMGGTDPIKNKGAVELMKDQELTKGFSTTLTGIGNGDSASHVEIDGIPEVDVPEVLQEVARELEMEQVIKQQLQPFEAQLKQLEERKNQLKNNPTFGDKFKAFFKHGLKGVEGEIAKVDAKIDATKIAINDVKNGVTVEQRQEILDRMKHNQGAIAHEMGMAKSVVLERNLEVSMPSMGTKVSDQDLDDAINRHEGLEPARKELAAQIKTQEKVLKVREALGKDQQTPKVDAPKQHLGVK